VVPTNDHFMAAQAQFWVSLSSAGGLIACGTSVGDALRREAMYVDPNLTGAKTGELSVETVTRYKLILEPEDRSGYRCPDPARGPQAGGLSDSVGRHLSRGIGTV
jgi:hypothetical protein